MIYNFLVNHFIKNSNNSKDKAVRESYGLLSGIVGIFINTTIFIIELVIGLLLNSIALMADSIHNLTDTASSIITIFSFKLSSKPADKDHPFGHGRIEYIASLVISFLVLLVGFEFVKTSFSRIFHPVDVKFSLVSFMAVLIPIPLKLWLGNFNKKIGKTIDSSTLEASGVDALNDVFILSGVALSLLISRLTNLDVDGYVGLIVAGIIIYSAFTLIKETLNPLLGEAPSKELVDGIISGVTSYEYISGVHDLIVHNYGPGRCMASVHAEVPCNISIVKIHEVIDKAEKELSEKLGIILVIHMDPINTDNEEITKLKAETIKILKSFPEIRSIHDFRVVGEGEIKNLIFDVVVDSLKIKHEENKDEFKEKINSEIKKVHPNYNVVLTVDRDYTCS